MSELEISFVPSLCGRAPGRGVTGFEPIDEEERPVEESGVLVGRCRCEADIISPVPGLL